MQCLAKKAKKANSASLPILGDDKSKERVETAVSGRTCAHLAATIEWEGTLVMHE